MSYRVLIPTAGTGSRLGRLTRFLNKSLVAVANRPVLSHLIERFPLDVEFVIALGHKGDLVREFVSLAYPNRTFRFAEVHPFEGPGSGLGLSVLCCSDYLQEPFIFCSCDTLVEEPIPRPDYNWMGYAKVADLIRYRTVAVLDGYVQDVFEKGVEGSELAAYIGLAGIRDYRTFWEAMESGGEEAVRAGEAHGFRSLLRNKIKAVPFTWWDTGNPDALARARERYRRPDEPNILDKPNEAIWFVDHRVIKFSEDEDFISNRVRRASGLTGFCPPVVATTPHMYQYRMVEGQVLSVVITLPLFRRFLVHSACFWERHSLTAEEQDNFRRNCLVFYRDKTEQRIRQFYQTFNRKDGTEPINGVSMPSMADLLETIDWNWLTDGMPGRFHGDFHFENIIWSADEEAFTFLDWRQEFGGSLATGDIYYDLAKLLHGLIVSHELITRNLYEVEWGEGNIRFDLLRRQVLVECEVLYEGWLQVEGYDIHKVRVLTALIYINIAALHHHPYCFLLYALGKWMLKNELELL